MATNNMDELIEWSSFEDDAWWDALVEDMENEGYDKKTGEYYWTEMSHYKYDGHTNRFDVDNESEKKKIEYFIE